MKKKSIFLAVLAIILVLGSSIGTAIAYFTSFVVAKGGYVIDLSPNTELVDEYDSQKRVQIKNTAQAGLEPLFVRVRVFNGTDSTISVTSEKNTNGVELWIKKSESDPYYYYTEVLYGQDTSLKLNIDVKAADGANIKEGDKVDVIVVYESVPAVFTEAGIPDMDTAWATGDITVIS